MVHCTLPCLITRGSRGYSFLCLDFSKQGKPAQSIYGCERVYAGGLAHLWLAVWHISDICRAFAVHRPCATPASSSGQTEIGILILATLTLHPQVSQVSTRELTSFLISNLIPDTPGLLMLQSMQSSSESLSAGQSTWMKVCCEPAADQNQPGTQGTNSTWLDDPRHLELDAVALVVAMIVQAETLARH